MHGARLVVTALALALGALLTGCGDEPSPGQSRRPAAKPQPSSTSPSSTARPSGLLPIPRGKGDGSARLMIDGNDVTPSGKPSVSCGGELQHEPHVVFLARPMSSVQIFWKPDGTVKQMVMALEQYATASLSKADLAKLHTTRTAHGYDVTGRLPLEDTKDVSTKQVPVRFSFTCSE